MCVGGGGGGAKTTWTELSPLQVYPFPITDLIVVSLHRVDGQLLSSTEISCLISCFYFATEAGTVSLRHIAAKDYTSEGILEQSQKAFVSGSVKTWGQHGRSFG